MISIENIRVGDSEEISNVITTKMVEDFANLTGDNNPIHIDEDYAKNTIFGKRIAHGMLGVSFFSRIFGSLFPGPGCIYLSQQVRFLKPIFIEDRLISKVVVESIDIKSRRVSFKTTATVENNSVLTGIAEIYFP